MKEEQIEYERKTEEKKLIKCNGCQKRWETRSDDSCNLIVLNCTIGKRRTYCRSNRNFRSQDFDRSLWSGETYRIQGEDYVDLCNSCWSSSFDTSSAIEITEEDYYLDEKKTEIYYCDFCSDKLGESSENTVSVNPSIVVKSRVQSMNTFDSYGEWNTATRNIGENVSSGSRDKMDSRREDCHDICESCMSELFEDDDKQTSSFFKSVANGFSSALYKLV